MQYQQFKDYLIGFLWRKGDQVLIDNLESLIAMGDASLNRDFRHERRHRSALLPVNSETYPLPADYYAMRSLAAAEDRTGEYEYVEPADIISWRATTKSNNWYPIYSIEDTSLMLVGPAQDVNPNNDVLNLVVNYRAKIPDYKTLNVSYMSIDYLDVYVPAVLQHASLFLRDDDRVPIWMQTYDKLIESYNEMSAHEQARGQSRMKPLARAAGVNRRYERRAHKLKGW